MNYEGASRYPDLVKGPKTVRAGDTLRLGQPRSGSKRAQGRSFRRLTPEAKAEMRKAESRSGAGEARTSGVNRRVGTAGTAQRAIPTTNDSRMRPFGGGAPEWKISWPFCPAADING